MGGARIGQSLCHAARGWEGQNGWGGGQVAGERDVGDFDRSIDVSEKAQ